MPATENTEITALIADVREQVLFLQELGVEALDTDFASFEAENEKLKMGRAVFARPSADPIPETNFKSKITERKAVSIITYQKEVGLRESRLAALPSLSKLASAAPARKPEISMTEAKHKTALIDIMPALPEPTETIAQIRAEIGPDCARCKLSTLGRKQVVNSTGNFDADLMFCGEAPGADEDEQGFPFVGRAGQLLTKIIESIGLKREDVFIGNINRCRPPGNRAPEPDETIACKPFLRREIAVIRPKVIVVLGATAAQNLLETKVPIGKLRGHFHDYLGVKVMPTFHPAYLLRDPHKKREVWEDMKMVRDYLIINQ